MRTRLPTSLANEFGVLRKRKSLAVLGLLNPLPLGNLYGS
jgi:hypothetical protein